MGVLSCRAFVLACGRACRNVRGKARSFLLACCVDREIKMYKLKERIHVRPILKWAGGKSQLLPSLLPKVPSSYNRYVEPFVGGAALFFALQPERAIISDSNPELINLYQQVAENVEDVIAHLKRHINAKDEFYRVRAQKWENLSPSAAAARMIYLNRTCFNGLYRVNRKGEFNTPFGNYKNPKICDEENLRSASLVLRRAQIVCGDYLDILKNCVECGDFVFLDPPYIPVGEYGDFKRYTKEQFYDEDQVRLAEAVRDVQKRNAWTILTNSNHPRVFELYEPYPIVVENTKRNISCKGVGRSGQDVIVQIQPISLARYENACRIVLPAKTETYPPTRYMGSKRKLLKDIYRVVSRFEFDTALDLFSGSGVVGNLFKSMGKRTISNDYMAMSAVFAQAMIENNRVILEDDEARQLLHPNQTDPFVSQTFRGLYFTEEENATIDSIRSNIKTLQDPYKRAIALTALIRACTKKRPRGLFTYVGLRYNDGRRDLLLSMAEQFLEGVHAVNEAVFDNGKENLAGHGDALSVSAEGIDLVYMDPPYYTPKSDNEYVRRYHFLEGLARDWEGVEIQENTQTKKFKSYPTPFSTASGAYKAFDVLFERFRKSVIVVSYSSNSLPCMTDMIALLKKYKEHVDVEQIDYHYQFANRSDDHVKRDRVQEYIFVAY